MKNGSISEQLKMQEKELRQEHQQRNISHEKENKQRNIQTSDFENKFANSQNFNTANPQSVNQENKQSINLPDLGLSSALGLFTPDISKQEAEQAPVKKKKKIPKKGLGR